MERKLVIYGTYFSDFYEEQPDKVRDKIDFVLDLVKYEEKVPRKFFKFLSGTDGLYEIKVPTVYRSIRIFCFFDEGRLVILAYCFVKKSQKTPGKHLNTALKLKREYFREKMLRS